MLYESVWFSDVLEYSVVERQMVATIDKWKNLTMEDIRKLEEENRKDLEERIKSKEIAMA